MVKHKLGRSVSGPASAWGPRGGMMVASFTSGVGERTCPGGSGVVSWLTEGTGGCGEGQRHPTGVPLVSLLWG